VVPTVSAHAHNIFVQVLFEFGIVGFVLFCAGLAGLFARIWRAGLPRDLEAAAAGLMAVVAIYASVDTDLWSIYFWSAVGLSALLLTRLAVRS
jgi:O-antigen ligase